MIVSLFGTTVLLICRKFLLSNICIYSYEKDYYLHCMLAWFTCVDMLKLKRAITDLLMPLMRKK